MTESKDIRIKRLCNYLIRSYKHNKASILFALYLNQFIRNDVEESIKEMLKEEEIEVVLVDAGEHKDLPSFFSSMDSKNIVFFVHNLEKGFPETIQFLNFKREELVDHRVKVVFWTTEEELSRISVGAPDFFAFRNRVVEFMEMPEMRTLGRDQLELALRTEYSSLAEIMDSIKLKESLLSELSTDTEISGYLLGSLGSLYDQIGDYKTSIDYSKRALKISKEIGHRHGESNYLGNIGIAYMSLGQVEKAIGYFEKALEIDRETGYRMGEANQLGNIGVIYRNKDNTDKSLEFHQQALEIDREIGYRMGEANQLGNIGNIYGIKGDIEKALQYHQQALETDREIGYRMGEAIDLANIGYTYSIKGDSEKALEYFEQAQNIFESIGASHLVDKVQQIISEIKAEK